MPPVPEYTTAACDVRFHTDFTGENPTATAVVLVVSLSEPVYSEPDQTQNCEASQSLDTAGLGPSAAVALSTGNTGAATT